MDSDNLPKQPFTSYSLDSERDKPKRDIFSISLNEKERKILNRFKQETNIPMDSKALKVLAIYGANVMNGDSQGNILRYLTSKDRTKILD